jgi:hypothetical protein
MRDSGQEVEEQTTSGLNDLVRDHSGPAGGAAALFIAFNVDGALGSLQWVLRDDARILLCFAITYAVRWTIHLRLGYLDVKTRAARILAVVTGCDLSLAIGLVVLAVRAVEHSTLGRVVLVAVPMALLVSISAGLTVLILTGNKELKNKQRGTDWVGDHVRCLKRLLDTLTTIPILSACGRLLDTVTPDSRVSAYVTGLVTLTISMSSGIATGYAVHVQTASVKQRRSVIAQILHPRDHLQLPPWSPAAHTAALSARPGSNDASCSGLRASGAIGQNQPVAPRQARLALERLFAGGENDGIGAGCPWVAHPERLQASRWWETGWCGSQLQSLAVAGPSGSAMMFGQVAVLARYLAMRGLLDGASTMTDVGTGDFQVISTGYGDVIAIRAVRTDIAAGGHLAGPCAGSTGHTVPYVELPPAMAVLWAQLIEQRHQWLWPVDDESGRGRAYDFLANKAGGATVARGMCDRGGDCSLTDPAGKRSRRFALGLNIRLASIMRFAPKRIA